MIVYVSRRLKVLSYKVVPLSRTSLVAEDAEPLEVTLNGFRCTVTAQLLTAEPEDDYDDVAEANSVLQPALEAWSATSELIDMTPVAFELQGHHFEVVVPEGDQVIYAHSIAETVAFGEVMAVAKNKFPPPHESIRVERPVVSQLRRRWRNVVQGTESPVAVSYFVLTTIEREYQGRKRAAQRLNILPEVLDHLGRISSTYDPVRGRKAVKQGEVGTITDEQLHWLKYVCPVIIRRVLEFEAGADISHTIKKDDPSLPPLSS